MVNKPNKTQATEVSVDTFLSGVTPEERQKDAIAVCEIMAKLSGEPARMWGPSIVGFGVRHYKYDTGREGSICKIGFAPRKNAIVLYIAAAAETDPVVARLGKVTTGKSCIYVKKLSDVDLGVLETLIGRALRDER